MPWDKNCARANNTEETVCEQRIITFRSYTSNIFTA